MIGILSSGVGEQLFSSSIPYIVFTKRQAAMLSKRDKNQTKDLSTPALLLSDVPLFHMCLALAFFYEYMKTTLSCKVCTSLKSHSFGQRTIFFRCVSISRTYRHRAFVEACSKSTYASTKLCVLILPQFKMKLDERTAWSLEGARVAHPTDCSLSSRFEEILSKPGQRHLVALVNAETGVEVTYGQLNEQANQLARRLLARIHRSGLSPNAEGDNIVALRFLPGQELVVALLAIFKAGLAYVPIAPNWPEGRIQHILEDCAPIMVVTNTNARLIYRAENKVTGGGNQREILQYEDLMDEATAKKVSTENLSDNESIGGQVTGSTLYTVLYTSGSTGKPKGVRHLHSAALNRIHWQWDTFPYTEDEVCVFKTTLTFIDSVIEIWAPLLSGKRLVIMPTKFTENVERFVDTLETFNIGRIFVVTSLVKSILAYLNLKKGRKRLDSVKIWECSAETVTKEVLLDFFEYFNSGHRISNFYGSTEMSDVTFETFTNSEEVLAVLWEDKVLSYHHLLPSKVEQHGQGAHWDSSG